MKYIWTKWCIFDDCLCVCYLTLHDYSSLVEGERHGILLLLLLPILFGEFCFECVKQVFAVRQGCGLYALMGNMYFVHSCIWKRLTMQYLLE